MNTLRKLVEQIYEVCTEDLSANLGYTDHIEYIEYRIQGGLKSEEDWFRDQCKPISK